MPKNQVIALYMPVLHRGYLQFFEAFPKAKDIYVFSQNALDGIDYLRKDLRALNPEQQLKTLRGLNIFSSVRILTAEAITQLDTEKSEIVLPDEDISRELAKALKNADVRLYPVFLRWDRANTTTEQPSASQEVVTADEFQQSVMKQAMEQAKTSSDIWRRVGAVIITKNKEKLVASNKGEPTAHSPWMEGDPRNIFNRGVGIEMSLFSHAEATLIAEAAKRGLKLEGATIYASTFPCPACAKLIAHSGIKTCYYNEGYSVLDGAQIMKEYGVNLIRVEMPDSNAKNPEAVAYPK